MNFNLVKKMALLALVVVASNASAESTAFRFVYEINIDGATGTHYYRAAGALDSTEHIPWNGNASCKNATYAYTRDLAGQQAILSVVLSAKAMGREVKFVGSCDDNGNYLRATRVIVQ